VSVAEAASMSRTELYAHYAEIPRPMLLVFMLLQHTHAISLYIIYLIYLYTYHISIHADVYRSVWQAASMSRTELYAHYAEVHTHAISLYIAST